VSALDVKDVGHALRARWWLLVVGLVVGGLLALGGGLLTPPVYTAHARLSVAPAGSPATALPDRDAVRVVASFADRLVGDDLARRVIDRLDLATTPRELSERITAVAVPDTTMLDITVEDSSARGSQTIAAATSAEGAELIEDLETPEGATRSKVDVTIAERAERPRVPVERPLARNLALGLAVGLLSGFGIALGTTPSRTTASSRKPPAHAAGMTARVVGGRGPGDHRATST
jgi:receptor protein-tyrosine kinase